MTQARLEPKLEPPEAFKPSSAVCEDTPPCSLSTVTPSYQIVITVILSVHAIHTLCLGLPVLYNVLSLDYIIANRV